MKFKRGDMCYILENNNYARQAKVVSKQGSLYVIQLIGSCGAIRLKEDRLFETEVDAMASRKTIRAIVSPQVSMIPQSNKYNIPDVFDGRRKNRSPHTFKVSKRR